MPRRIDDLDAPTRPDITDTLVFLEDIYSSTDRGFVTISTASTASDFGKLKTYPVEMHQELAEAIVAASKNLNNVYVNAVVQKTAPKRRGSIQDASALTALWVEFDGQHGEHKGDQAGLFTDFADMQETLRRHPSQPSLIVSSGGGWHCWWILDEPHEITDENRAETIALMRQWGRWWQTQAKARDRAIDSVFDLARVLRPPGTRNYKGDGAGTTVEIIERDAALRYSLDELLSVCEQGEDDEVHRVSASEHAATDATQVAQTHSKASARQTQLQDDPEQVWNPSDAAQLDSGKVGDFFNESIDDVVEWLQEKPYSFHSARPPRLATVANGDQVTAIDLTRAGKDAQEGHSVTVFPESKIITLWSTTGMPEAIVLSATDVNRSKPTFDPFGFYTHWHHDGDFSAAREQLLREHPEWAPSIDEAAEEARAQLDPKEVLSLQKAAATFDLRLLPTSLRMFIEHVAKSTQSPPEFAMQMTFTALSTATLGTIDISPNPPSDWREPIILWTLGVGEPSTRKSAVVRSVIDPLSKVFDEVDRSNLTAALKFQSQVAAQKQRIKAVWKEVEKAINDGEDAHVIEQKINAHTDETVKLAEIEEEAPLSLKFIRTDVTSEAIARTMHEHGGRAALFSAEGQVIDAIAGRYSDQASAKNFNHGWSKERMVIERADIKRPTMRIDTAIINVGLLIQPNMIERMLTAGKGQLSGEGTTARFLYSWPIDRTDAALHLASANPMLDDWWTDTLRTLVQRSQQAQQSQTIEVLHWQSDAVKDTYLDAAKTWRERARDLAHHNAPIRAWLGKAHGQLARLASVIALSDDPRATQIAQDHLDAAISLTESYFSESLRTFGEMEQTSLISVQRVINYISSRRWRRDQVDNQPIDSVRSRQVKRGTNSVRWQEHNEEVDDILDLLVEAKALGVVADSHTSRLKAAGRPTVFYIVPDDFEQHYVTRLLGEGPSLYAQREQEAQISQQSASEIISSSKASTSSESQSNNLSINTLSSQNLTKSDEGDGGKESFEFDDNDDVDAEITEPIISSSTSSREIVDLVEAAKRAKTATDDARAPDEVEKLIEQGAEAAAEKGGAAVAAETADQSESQQSQHPQLRGESYTNYVNRVKALREASEASTETTKLKKCPECSEGTMKLDDGLLVCDNCMHAEKEREQ